MSLMKYENRGVSFEYDTDIWEVRNGFLRFKESYVGPIDLPKGVPSCVEMFSGVHMREGCFFRDFDTTDIKNMQGMFSNASFPEGFSFGEKFVTDNVTNMNKMFESCTFPENFKLPETFRTLGVTNMESMFENCRLPVGFDFGESFTLEGARYTRFMFRSAFFSDGIKPRNKLDVRDDCISKGMFKSCKFPNDFVASEWFSKPLSKLKNLGIDLE